MANWRELNRQVTPAFAAAVIKANAYGMGAGEVGVALAQAGCRLFFVARLEEAIQLRLVLNRINLSSQPMVAVLDGYVAGQGSVYNDHDLMPVISSIEQLRAWVMEQSKSLQHRAILHFDTGMNRIGLSLEDCTEVAAVSHSLTEAWWGVISHLANDEEPDDPWAQKQKQRLDLILPQIPHQRASLAASSGIGMGYDFHYDFVRPGLGLYGLYPIHLAGKIIPLQPALSVYGRVIQCRMVDAGAAVGYGATEVMEKGGRVAVIGLGYADFFPRALDPNHPLTVKVAGYQVRPIGRVSMDLLTLDISSIPTDLVKAGDWAEVVGDENTVLSIATAASTSPYEILTRLGHRALRQVIQP